MKPSPITGRILVIDDIVANRNLLRETLEPPGYEVLLAPDGKAGLKAATVARPDVILLDVMMPGMDGFETCRALKSDPATRSIPVIFITARDETQFTVEGFQAGGVDYIAKPFQAQEVLARIRTHLENARLTREISEKNSELELSNQRLRDEINRRETAEASLEQADSQLSVISQIEAKHWGIDAMIGTSEAMTRTVAELRKIQRLNKTSVLILGESGTGKELYARAIHFGGPRAKGPFVPVNCAAVPADLMESLFFGHMKGAFSGAAMASKGYFEMANGGTLFLDEVGDMPLPLQAKLLRVLESGQIQPLGSEREKFVDVRVVAATNSNLESKVAGQKFRADLFFRLATFVAELPPLRNRRDDIAPLAKHFVHKLSVEMGVGHATLSAEAIDFLAHCDFPGNIRELKNLIERALIESGGGEILTEHLEFHAFAFQLNEPDNLDAQEPCNAHGLPAALILKYVQENGTINNTQCRELLNVDVNRAWYLLNGMHRSGRLVQLGSRRWARYRLP